MLVNGTISDSSLTLLNSAGTLDVAELSGSKVKVEGLGYTLFNGQRDLLVRNNLIQVEPAAANGVSDESANELFASGGEYPSPRQQPFPKYGSCVAPSARGQPLSQLAA